MSDSDSQQENLQGERDSAKPRPAYRPSYKLKSSVSDANEQHHRLLLVQLIAFYCCFSILTAAVTAYFMESAEAGMFVLFVFAMVPVLFWSNFR